MASKEYVFNFRAVDGWTYLDDADFAPELQRQLGSAGQARRASHVLPAGRLKRLAFRLVRRIAGDNGRLAEWTRRWKGRWLADMAPSGGPVLGSFPTRAEALAGERDWLLVNVFAADAAERRRREIQRSIVPLNPHEEI